jgi:hypothetical protein
MIMSRFDKLEGKTPDYVDQSAEISTSKQPQYGMPYNYYENQCLYAAANKAKLASLVLETDKTNLGGVGPSLHLVTLIKIGVIMHEPIKDQQRIKLRQRKTRVFLTLRSHQVKSICLIMTL